MKIKQLEFKGVSGWGGKRRGAGRKRTSRRVRHERRPKVTARTPILLTIKLSKVPFSLRTRRAKRIFENAALGAKRFGLWINHFSLQGDHLHMVCESESTSAVSRGMRSFNTRLAKQLKKSHLAKAKSILQGRYHMKVLKTPTEVKRAIRYVLLNICKHAGLRPHIDRFSSANLFNSWKELIGVELRMILNLRVPKYLQPPSSWLGTVGWMRGR